jgi:hypothetical protein
MCRLLLPINLKDRMTTKPDPQLNLSSLSPADFKTLAKNKGWTYRALALRWKLSEVRISQIARDKDAAIESWQPSPSIPLSPSRLLFATSNAGTSAFWLSMLFRLIVGSLVGLIAWGSGDSLGWVVAILVLPIVWGLSVSRWQAGAVMLGYFLAGARGLPGGTVVFFGSDTIWWVEYGFWLAACLLLTLPFVVFWARNHRWRAVGFVGALVVCVVPPLGLIGWLSPLAVGGALYPGIGWLGVVMTLVLLSALSSGAWRWAGGMLMVAVLVNVLAVAVWRPVVMPGGWAGVDTHFPQLGSGGYGDAGWMLEARQRVGWVNRFIETVPANSVRVLPETVLGRYDGIAQFDLMDASDALAARGSRVLVGAEVPEKDGRYLNALVVLGTGMNDSGQAVQGVPVPVSMWKPWGKDGAVADVWGRGGRVTVNGVKAGVVICYEQLLSWSMLKAVSGTPDVLVGAANGWWAKDTSIPAIQREMMRAYGRLFGVGVVMAGNL